MTCRRKLPVDRGTRIDNPRAAVDGRQTGTYISAAHELPPRIALLAVAVRPKYPEFGPKTVQIYTPVYSLFGVIRLEILPQQAVKSITMAATRNRCLEFDFGQSITASQAATNPTGGRNP